MTLSADKRGLHSRGLLIYFALVTLSLLGGVIVPLYAEERSLRKDVTLTGTHSNAQFLAGRSVRISAEVEDDVFVAGLAVILVPFLRIVVALLAVAAGLGAVVTITWSLVRPGLEAVPS